MIDKHIIDGVNVAECEFYNADDETCREENSKYPIDICEFAKCEGCNCYYKQLKRKEQECEELKIYIKSNEQQVKEVEMLVMDNDRLINELNQFKQTLAEIKEIAEWHTTNADSEDIQTDMKQILRKISEVEL